jgi:ABC-type Fe3+-siderophore transport system permease subunit
LIRAGGLAAGLVLLVMASLLLGARPGFVPGDLLLLLDASDPGNAKAIILHDMRLPRTLAALMAGASLGVAGAVIQTLSRNPLADPGLLGVNAGAALAIVLTVTLTGPLPEAALVLPALAGATLAASLVWMLGAASASPLTLILGGAALTAILGSALRALILIDGQALDVWRFWVVGSVDATGWSALTWALLPAVAGAVLAVVGARRLDAMSLGDDMAQALGTRLGPTRRLALATVALLATAAVLVAGPLVFVGLVAPHMARMLGADGTLRLFGASALCGGGLVLAADIVGRVAFRGLAVEAGLGVTLIGGCVLVALIRQQARPQ